MPSIWITSKSRPERSDAIHSFRRAADSATKRRETADFDRPAPTGAGTSPARAVRRAVEHGIEPVSSHGSLQSSSNGGAYKSHVNDCRVLGGVFGLRVRRTMAPISR